MAVRIGVPALRAATASFSAQSDSKILFLAYVTIPPVEAMAVVNYANNYLPGLVHDSGLLTSTGFMVSMVLLAVMVGFNFLAIRLVLAINLPIAVIGHDRDRRRGFHTAAVRVRRLDSAGYAGQERLERAHVHR